MKVSCVFLDTWDQQVLLNDWKPRLFCQVLALKLVFGSYITPLCAKAGSILDDHSISSSSIYLDTVPWDLESVTFTANGKLQFLPRDYLYFSFTVHPVYSKIRRFDRLIHKNYFAQFSCPEFLIYEFVIVWIWFSRRADARNVSFPFMVNEFSAPFLRLARTTWSGLGKLKPSPCILLPYRRDNTASALSKPFMNLSTSVRRKLDSRSLLGWILIYAWRH